MIGGHGGSGSHLSMTFGGGFLGCSVIFSMMVCGWRVTLTLSMTSPGGVGFLFLSCLTTGGGVGSLTLSTVLFGGETLQSPPHGGGGGGHPQDIFKFFRLVVYTIILFWKIVCEYLQENIAPFIAEIFIIFSIL